VSDALRVERRPVVGVMGSGTEAHAGWAAPLGRALARRGVHLLTGGGRGVMRSVSEAFVAVRPRAGLCVGILPGLERPGPGRRTPEGYPNPAVELPIVTHLPHSGERGTDPLSRNHLNVLSAAAVVALPGGPGTRSEVELALRYGTPVALHGPAEAFAGFPDGAPHHRRLEALEAWLDGVLPGA
jgi:predicted Rossmann-fold nucleotide-binding protein